VITSIAPVVFSFSLALSLVGAIGLMTRRKRARPETAPLTPGRGRDVAGLDRLLIRAGRGGQMTARSVVTARVVGAIAFPLIGLPIAGWLPGRTGMAAVAGLAVLGFLLPNMVLERAARRRSERIAREAPDALDLLSVQLGAGRSVGSAMEDFARSGRGPLAAEMGVAASEMARGMPQAVALGRLRERAACREVSTFCASVNRSRRLGSPLAVELRRQASTARIEQGRTVAERAARAAPKIQLVIALVLVPAVMLLVAAALVANSDRLIGFAFG
jgi:tight adherence protein C